MALGRAIVDGTMVAAADYSTTGQYLCVENSTTNNTVTLTTTDGQFAYGILQNKPTSGGAAEVAVLGIAKAMCGAPVTRGQRLKAEVTTSRVIPVAAAADYGLCIACNSGADGEVIDVIIVHTGADSD